MHDPKVLGAVSPTPVTTTGRLRRMLLYAATMPPRGRRTSELHDRRQRALLGGADDPAEYHA
jgi:hypothetical protein